MRYFVVFLMLVSSILISMANSQLLNENGCGPNEIFKSCGSPCERRCNQKFVKFCAAVCKSGCFCNNGYCKNEKNECVRDLSLNNLFPNFSQN
uniref:Putative til domain-containing cysteine-rich salivary secreted peptide n=1 Tax=Corethrella appendiculata TaxID=1370023 RepID=U5EFV4_9DIPT